MKKIISFLITFTLLFSLAALPTNAAVSETEGITALLKELEIMQGDENGDMMLDKKVSRAEFAKIAIAASPQKNSVALGLRQSPFRDVPYTQWYAPYVKAAVSANYVVGYLDATFRPENTVTYEEAATIMLRVLGYDDSSFTDAYPYGQLSKAQSLDLLDDVNGEMGMEMTRYQVMYMVYNALNATTSSNSKLYSSHDCTLKENTDIISTADQDDTLGADKVFTSAGTYTKGGYFNDESAGMTGDLYIKNNKDAVAFVPDSGNNSNGYDSYFVYSVLSNASIVGYRNGHFEEIDIPNGATVYRNQQPTTYAAVKNELEMGDTLYVKRTQNGSVDYVTYDTNNLEGPVTVTGDGWMARVGAKQTSKVFRSGVESSASAVSVNDIVYYSEPLDVVFGYTDKVTGVYEKAAPTKDSPTTVTVSGKEYKIESVEAFNALSSSGSFKYGDTVTLLLGRTGEVAGVAGKGTAAVSTSGGTSSGTVAGFVIEAGKKDFTNADNTVSSSYYAKIVSTDGSIGEYQTASDYKTLVCGAVRVTFKNGKAVLSRSTKGSVSGRVSASKGMIGGDYVADDVKILDTSGTYNDDIPLYRSVYMQRLDGITLNSNSVLYSSKNSAGEIDELILKDVTGDTYTYGIITKADSTTGVYTIDINGTQSTYMTGFKSSTKGPCRLALTGSNIKSMQGISHYNTQISSLTQTEAVISGQTYLLSDDVVIYRKNIGETYLKIPIEDAISGNYRMTAYYDKAQSSGGRIRIIIAQDK
ncbi:MAG: S-layer homology domain-containing protein [Clostridia bacterium]|nr:S-layer homology domain-containing protein [Clostridia bacterium]